MLQNPHYSSHSEQQAALGCAANLDPEKHPRRYKLQQAREKFRPLKRLDRASEQARDAELLKQARALTHLPLTTAAGKMGVHRNVLTRLRDDYGLQFAPCRNASERLKLLAGTHPTMKELAEAAQLSYSHAYKLCKEYGIEPGVPYGQDAA